MTKKQLENLLQEIVSDPTSPGAREKLQGYRIKILSAYKEIETFLKNEDLEDAAARRSSRDCKLCKHHQSVRQLEDLHRNDDAVVKSKEEENNDDWYAIKSSTRFPRRLRGDSKMYQCREKDSPKVRTLMERLLSMANETSENIESSMKGEKEVSSGEEDSRNWVRFSWRYKNAIKPSRRSFRIYIKARILIVAVHLLKGND